MKVALRGARITLAIGGESDGGGEGALPPALAAEFSAPAAHLALPAIGITLREADIFASAKEGAWQANLSQDESVRLHASGDIKHTWKVYAEVMDFAPPQKFAPQVQWENLRATLAASAGADGVRYCINATFRQFTDVQRAVTLRDVIWRGQGTCADVAQCRDSGGGVFSVRAAMAQPALSVQIANAGWRKQGAQWQVLAPEMDIATDDTMWRASVLVNVHPDAQRVSVRTALPLPHRPTLTLTLDADAHWQESDSDWQLFSREVHLMHGDAAVHAQALLRGGTETAITAYAVTGVATGIALADVAHYLPAGEVQEWFADSLFGGSVTHAAFALASGGGFSAAETALHLTTAFEGGTLDIAEGWARAQDLHGTLVLRDDDILIHGSGMFDGLSATAVVAHLPKIYGAKNTLLLTIRSAPAPLGTMFAAARRTPATRDFIKQAEEVLNMKNRGSGELQLQITVPLALPEDAQAQATLAVRRGAVQTGGLPVYENIRGTMHFSNATYGGTLHGRLALADMAADAPPLQAVFDADNLVLRGVADVSVLLAAAGVHDAPLAGSTPFTVSRSARRMVFSASLDGTVIDLPAPLGKGGFEVATLSANLAARAAEVHYHGRQVTLHMRREGDGTDIAINGIAGTPPASGINLHGSAVSVDLDLWLAQADSGEAVHFATLQLTLREAELSGITNKRFIVSGRSGGAGQPLSLRLDASHSIGNVVFGTHRLEGAFSYLNIPLGSDTRSGGEGSHITSLTLDLSASTLVVGGLTLGALTLAGAPSGDVWQISTLRITNVHTTMDIGGVYEGAHTYLTMQLEVGELPALMTILQIPQVFGGGQVSIFGSIGWPGAPTDFSPARAIGDVRLLGSGVQYLDVDLSTDVVNFLSIFSPQSLFSLGFTELGKGGGIIFHTVEGDVSLNSGEAQFLPINLISRDLRMDIQGSTDFVYRRYNIHGRVRPGEKLLAAGSVVGLGTGLAALNPGAFVAGSLLGKVFEKPLSEIGAYDYTITGTWEEPVYEEVGITSEEDSAGGGG